MRGTSECALVAKQWLCFYCVDTDRGDLSGGKQMGLTRISPRLRDLKRGRKGNSKMIKMMT